MRQEIAEAWSRRGAAEANATAEAIESERSHTREFDHRRCDAKLPTQSSAPNQNSSRDRRGYTAYNREERRTIEEER